MLFAKKALCDIGRGRGPRKEPRNAPLPRNCGLLMAASTGAALALIVLFEASALLAMARSVDRLTAGSALSGVSYEDSTYALRVGLSPFRNSTIVRWPLICVAPVFWVFAVGITSLKIE